MTEHSIQYDIYTNSESDFRAFNGGMTSHGPVTSVNFHGIRSYKYHSKRRLVWSPFKISLIPAPVTKHYTNSQTHKR